jgi:hypothetical protein
MIFGVVLLLLLASSAWASPLQQNCATMVLSSPTVKVLPGGVAVLQVLLDADGVTFDVAGFLINFDPTLLRVVDVAGDPATQVESGDLPGTNVVKIVSNTEGSIEFAQAILGGQAGGTFTVATIRLGVIGQLSSGATTEVTFVNGVGNTGVYLAGQQLLCEFPGPATIVGWVSLTTNKTGSGRVTSVPEGIFCGADCTEIYAKDTVVTLTAQPGVKSYVEWGGDCVGAGNTAQLTMDRDKACTATFGYPVGGIVVSVNKVGLLVSWLGLVAVAFLVAVLSVVLVRRRKT